VSGALALELHEGPIERTPAELAVVGLFVEDRPLRGEAGRMDWRLCGRLSSLLAARTLSAERGAAALVQSSGGLATPFVMALGLGSRAGFDLEAGSAFVREAVGRGLRLGAGSLALGLPAPPRADLASRLEAALRSALASLAECPAELQLRLVTGPAERAPASDLLPALARRVATRGVTLRLVSDRVAGSRPTSPAPRGTPNPASPSSPVK
jgi:hypothetical protein